MRHSHTLRARGRAPRVTSISAYALAHTVKHTDARTTTAVRYRCVVVCVCLCRLLIWLPSLPWLLLFSCYFCRDLRRHHSLLLCFLRFSPQYAASTAACITDKLYTNRKMCRITLALQMWVPSFPDPALPDFMPAFELTLHQLVFYLFVWLVGCTNQRNDAHWAGILQKFKQIYCLKGRLKSGENESPCSQTFYYQTSCLQSVHQFDFYFFCLISLPTSEMMNIGLGCC